MQGSAACTQENTRIIITIATAAAAAMILMVTAMAAISPQMPAVGVGQQVVEKLWELVPRMRGTCQKLALTRAGSPLSVPAFKSMKLTSNCTI